MDRDTGPPQRTDPYQLLAQALRDSVQVAVTKIAMRERESLAILRERDRREIQMAIHYAQAKSEGYDLDAERDQYIGALEELLTAKTTGQPAPHEAEPAAARAPVVDLMAALKASIEEAQAQRDTAAAPAKKTAKKAPAKRTPRTAG